MDVEKDPPAQNYEKKANKMCALGTRKIGEGDTMSVGPTYIITVPESYTQDDMEELVDITMCAPDSAVGTAIAVREGVHFTKIDDGHHVKASLGCRCHYDEPDDEGWGGED